MMKRRSKFNIQKKIGYALLALYVIAVICLLVFSAGLNMLPVSYLVIIGLLMAVLGVVMAIMHEKQIASIIASIFTVILIILCIVGCYYIKTTQSTISEVSTAEVQTDVVSVYVLDSDPAKDVSDAAAYKFGIINKIDRTNTDKTIESIESDLNKTLDVTDYENMFVMMDELKANKIKAIVMNEAYVGVISDVEEYKWVNTDLRKLTTVEHHSEVEQKAETPEDVPETFVMYLSGIDTYGGISARSRSDVNILAVVNTKTKNILLLSTPRDAYVDYNMTGGAKDKLTHAGIFGVNASIDALERIYGVKVDYYMRLNFSGFENIIDSLGGIEVNSDYDFTVQNVKNFHVGINQLSGREALAFARERYSFVEGDAQRAKNQMEVIRAIVQKAASSSLLTNYGSVMEAVSGSFETSMPSEQIASLVKMQLSDMAGWNINSFATSGTSARSETYSMPGQQLYVLNLSQESIDKAKELISGVYGE